VERVRTVGYYVITRDPI